MNKNKRQNSSIYMRNAKASMTIGTVLPFSDRYLATTYHPSIIIIKDKPRNNDCEQESFS